MSNENEELKSRIAALERELAAVKAGTWESRLAALSGWSSGWMARRSVRRRSEMCIGPWPLYEVARGPDVSAGEIWGHARAIFAIGDIATGFIAIGNIARGVIAVGGLAVGLISLGGLSIGLGLAIGGLGIGTLACGGGAVGFVAIGGAAVGFIACGGGAAGYYAVGGAAVGKHVIDAMNQDPAAIQFFQNWMPGLNQFFPQIPPPAPPGAALPRGR
jgi:hypothetical protein